MDHQSHPNGARVFKKAGSSGFILKPDIHFVGAMQKSIDRPGGMYTSESWRIFHWRFRVLLELGHFQKMAILLVTLLLERPLSVIEYALLGFGSKMPIVNETLDFAWHADT